MPIICPFGKPNKNGWRYPPVIISLVRVITTPLLLIFTAISGRENKMDSRLIINTEEKYIEIPATFHPKQFNRSMGLKNHHCITWEKGSAAKKALFTTPVPDSAIHDALIKIGASPGDNLSNETWSRRNDAGSPYPDMLVEGSNVKVVFVKDSEVYQIKDFLIDEHGKDFDFRFGGNRTFIPIWKSGCVVCLQSCPGAKIGNHAYSIRDLVQGRSIFSISENSDFHEGDSFIIRFSIASEKE